MKKLSRREAMGNIITAGAGVTLAGMTEAAAQVPAAPAFRGQHQIRPLPFDPAKLKGISEKLIRSHHENNYSGAVRALNAVEQMRFLPSLFLLAIVAFSRLSSSYKPSNLLLHVRT